ncbi:MAG: alpha/beta fold hydrolase, partial [Actinomycetota bacterium]
MKSSTTTVYGQPAHYGEGGRGLPVVFLHGWGLDHHACEPSLNRLVARGCRVVAPSLPGFGETPGLPLHDQTVANYAQWVDDFMGAIGFDEPVVIVGHSFGGGIATALAHRFPERVRHLVLINAVGDPEAIRERGRRIGFSDVGRAIVDTLRPDARGRRTRAAQRIWLRNARRDLVRFAATAVVASSTDLRSEMRELSDRDLPVTVLWSDQDGLIPLSTFDTFCATLGADGEVVAGGHSWLLAHPDTFGTVVDNVLAAQTDEHRDESAIATRASLRRHLAATDVPKRTIERLLGGVRSLWLLSAPPNALAADLALCHPSLEAGEVRAVARPLDSALRHRVTVVAEDRPGLLADSVAILSDEGLSIESASAMTWSDVGLALHSLTVAASVPLDERRWAAIGERLETAEESPVRTRAIPPASGARVEELARSDDRTFIRVMGPDRPGFLAHVCRWLAEAGVSIEAADV